MTEIRPGLICTCNGLQGLWEVLCRNGIDRYAYPSHPYRWDLVSVDHPDTCTVSEEQDITPLHPLQALALQMGDSA